MYKNKNVEIFHGIYFSTNCTNKIDFSLCGIMHNSVGVLDVFSCPFSILWALEHEQSNSKS